jgi:nucleoside 2-deoxyribosyltransferase
MKFRAYLGIKYYEDNRNREEIESLVAVLENDGMEVVCIAKDFEKWGSAHFSSQELMQATFKEIDKSDFVVLEMSEKGVGLGIEAGYASAKGKPVIVLVKNGKELSYTIQGVAAMIIPYSQSGEIKISAHNQALQPPRA